MNAKTPRARPSWALTFSFWIALAALFFTSAIPLVFLLALIALWPHFISARGPRDSSAIWILRLILYGGVFFFYGGQPGIGADWIFDAKTFNMIGLIAAGEATLQMWRVPPLNVRYHSTTIFCIGVVFLAACNTYDDRYIRLLAPLYLLFTLLALREWRADASTPVHAFPRGRGALALVFVLVCGAATHFGVLRQRDHIMRWGYQLMHDRRFFQSSGISEQPNLGSTFNLRGSTRRVLKIEGPLNSGHLRAAVFDTYSHGRWSPPLSERQKEFFPTDEKHAAPSPAGGNRARVTKLADLNQLIFAPLNAVSVVPGEGSNFDWNPILGPMSCDDPAPYSYEVYWSDKGNDLGVPLHQGVLCLPLSASDKDRWLQLPPEIDPRVHELAVELTLTALHPAEKVEAVADYLLTSHKYSRTTRRGKGDPVSSFLLEKKAAHCEYFASATVVLLRAAGVPARYATGYMAHEGNGNETVVRQRDAHAWAEAWVEGVGWITVDATPADGTPAANDAVPAWQRAWEKLQDQFARWRERLSTLSREQLLVLIPLVIAVWGLERWRQRRKRRSAETSAFEYSAPAELAALARRFQTVLQKQGVEVSATKPLSEYSRADGTQRFLRDYNRARFGGKRDEQSLRNLTQQIELLEKGDDHDNGTPTSTKHTPVS